MRLMKGNDIKILVDNQLLGTAQSISADKVCVEKTEYFFPREASAKLTNAEISIPVELLQPFDIKMSIYKFPRKSLPKKKRIRKKWLKKYLVKEGEQQF